LRTTRSLLALWCFLCAGAAAPAQSLPPWEWPTPASWSSNSLRIANPTNATQILRHGEGAILNCATNWRIYRLTASTGTWTTNSTGFGAVTNVWPTGYYIIEAATPERMAFTVLPADYGRQARLGNSIMPANDSVLTPRQNILQLGWLRGGANWNRITSSNDFGMLPITYVEKISNVWTHTRTFVSSNYNEAVFSEGVYNFTPLSNELVNAALNGVTNVFYQLSGWPRYFNTPTQRTQQAYQRYAEDVFDYLSKHPLSNLVSAISLWNEPADSTIWGCTPAWPWTVPCANFWAFVPSRIETNAANGGWPLTYSGNFYRWLGDMHAPLQAALTNTFGRMIPLTVFNGNAWSITLGAAFTMTNSASYVPGSVKGINNHDYEFIGRSDEPTTSWITRSYDGMAQRMRELSSSNAVYIVEEQAVGWATDSTRTNSLLGYSYRNNTTTTNAQSFARADWWQTTGDNVKKVVQGWRHGAIFIMHAAIRDDVRNATDGNYEGWFAVNRGPKPATVSFVLAANRLNGYTFESFVSNGVFRAYTFTNATQRQTIEWMLTGTSTNLPRAGAVDVWGDPYPARLTEAPRFFQPSRPSE